MAFNRNNQNSKQNKKEMTVANLSHPISKENKKALEMLDKISNQNKKKRT